MSDLARFCSDLGVDEAAARAAIDKAEADASRQAPWFVQALMALGSWIAALVIIMFGGFLLALTLDLDVDKGFGLGLAILGGMSFAGGFAMLRGKDNGMFADQFGTAIAAAGQGMVASGAGMYTESWVIAAALSVPISAAVAWMLDSRILQFLSSGWTYILILVAFGEMELGYPLEITALGVAAGVALTLFPPARDLSPTAVVLLFVGPIVAILTDYHGYLGVPYSVFFTAWGARLIYGLVAVYLFYILWRHTEDASAQRRVGLFALAAAVLCILLPPGGAAAVVILVLAFYLGSHMLAALGVLLEIYFISKFYYDLDMTLLVKSGILIGAGLVLLGLWAVMMRAGPVEQKS